MALTREQMAQRVAKGADFASSGPKGELYRIPVAHLREFHEGWMPNWIEG